MAPVGNSPLVQFGFKRWDIWVLGKTLARALRPPLTRQPGVIWWEEGVGGATSARVPQSKVCSWKVSLCRRCHLLASKKCFFYKGAFWGGANKWMRSKGEEGGVTEGGGGGGCAKKFSRGQKLKLWVISELERDYHSLEVISPSPLPVPNQSLMFPFMLAFCVFNKATKGRSSLHCSRTANFPPLKRAFLSSPECQYHFCSWLKINLMLIITTCIKRNASERGNGQPVKCLIHSESNDRACHTSLRQPPFSNWTCIIISCHRVKYAELVLRLPASILHLTFPCQNRKTNLQHHSVWL